ncbi:MAG: hypothetical protein LBM02_03640 [Lachnospiraceae bacterium]|nr:hypothetical protein [Lachnospiraceae bacterium]
MKKAINAKFAKVLFVAVVLLIMSILLPNHRVSAATKAKPGKTKITSVTVTKTPEKPYLNVKWNKATHGTHYQVGRRSVNRSWKYWKSVAYTKKNLKAYTKKNQLKVVKKTYKSKGKTKNIFKVYRYVYSYKALTKNEKVLSKKIDAGYGKTYYIAVRAYNGKYGSWSNAYKISTGSKPKLKYTVKDDPKVCLISVTNTYDVPVMVNISYGLYASGKLKYSEESYISCIDPGKIGYAGVDKESYVGDTSRINLTAETLPIATYSKYVSIKNTDKDLNVISGEIHNSSNRRLLVSASIIYYKAGKVIFFDGGTIFKRVGKKGVGFFAANNFTGEEAQYNITDFDSFKVVIDYVIDADEFDF